MPKGTYSRRSGKPRTITPKRAFGRAASRPDTPPAGTVAMDGVGQGLGERCRRFADTDPRSTEGVSPLPGPLNSTARPVQYADRSGPAVTEWASRRPGRRAMG